MEFFSDVTALATLAIVVVQQILKLNIVPVYFANKYPVLTNVALSIIAAVIVTWQTAVDLVGWKDWVVYIATLFVLSAITYNMTIRNSEKVQSISNQTGPSGL